MSLDMNKKKINLTKRPSGGVAADLDGASPDMAKRAQKASTALSMIDLDDLDIEIILVLDGSYSMNRDYQNDLVQLLTDRVTAFALAADADGKVPLIPFDGKVRRIIELTKDNAEGIVKAEVFGPGVGGKKKGLFGKLTGGSETIWPTADDMTSTNLTAALASARKIVEKSGRFTMVIVIGDGSPNDGESATDETIALGQLGAFVKFVALRSVSWLDEVDNLERTHPGRREYDNVSAVDIPDPRGVSDLEFYKKITKELDLHIQRATAAGYLGS